MNEAHFAEIEDAPLRVRGAQARREAIKKLQRDNSEPHLVAALAAAEHELELLGRTLMQKTYFAVPKEQLSF